MNLIIALLNQRLSLSVFVRLLLCCSAAPSCAPDYPVPSAAVAQLQPAVVDVEIQKKQEHWPCEPILHKCKCLVYLDELLIDVAIRAADEHYVFEFALDIVILAQEAIADQGIHDDEHHQLNQVHGCLSQLPDSDVARMLSLPDLGV